MSQSNDASLSPSSEHRRIAAQQFDRARQALNGHNYDYAIDLLCTCCKLEPANLTFRQVLRRTEKVKFKNNMRGSLFASLTTYGAKLRMSSARRSKNWTRVLECGEAVLRKNPWDTAIQLEMAVAAERLGLGEVAVFILEQARQKNPRDARVNRPLAELYERQGHFNKAIVMWDLVAKANPRDGEAARKGKDLAATHTIIQGNYEEAALGGPDHEQEEVLTPGGAAPKPSANQLAKQAQPWEAKIQADPSTAGPYLQLFSIYHNAGETDKARRTLEEGLANTGQNFEIGCALAELDIEPYRENLRLTEERLNGKPEDEGLRRLRARLQKEINSREMELFRQRSDRFPSDMQARMEFGVRLLRAGLVDEAIQELQQVRKDPRQRCQAIIQLGHCFLHKKNWPLAKRNFEEALQTAPVGDEASRKEILFNLAHGAAEHDDWTTAIDLGNELANLDYGYRQIGKLLEGWQAKHESKATT
jgi:tetratricopeptide (TPR) repeat protein